ncbi:MAG: acyl-CoA dehydrogenase family protein, partial [Shewanella sp.]|nr:acyl-CoA dehydrogenase family protein [Shewanella sp.]
MNLLYTSLNFGLREEVDMLRDSVSQFAANEIAPIAAKVDEQNAFPNELWPVLGDMGLLGITVAEEYGGANMSYLAHVVAMEEISRASASVGF